VAGVPEGTVVAHKFGERVNDDGQGHITDLEIHDCGIVYNKSGDYLLCVMTKGKQKADLLNTIQEISKLVYLDKMSLKD
jgi:hypothetical protein